MLTVVMQLAAGIYWYSVSATVDEIAVDGVGPASVAADGDGHAADAGAALAADAASAADGCIAQATSPSAAPKATSARVPEVRVDMVAPGVTKLS